MAWSSEPCLCRWFPRLQDHSKPGISPGLASPGLPPVHRLPLRPQREVSPPCTHLSRASRWVSGSFSPRKQLKLGYISGRGALGRGPDPARSTQLHSLCSFLVLHVVQPNYWPQLSCRFLSSSLHLTAAEATDQRAVRAQTRPLLSWCWEGPLLPPALQCVPWGALVPRGRWPLPSPGAACTLLGTPHQENTPLPRTPGGAGRYRPALPPGHSTAESGPETQRSWVPGH